jgi:hypothetical protein
MLDERFLTHRLRSTSHAGVACALMVIGWFAYEYYLNDTFRADLATIVAITVVIKVSLMIWYRLND